MLTPATLAIANAIHNADLSSTNLKAHPDYQKRIILWSDYLQACREMFKQKTLLTDELLQKYVRFIENSSDLSGAFPSGYKCCLTVVPCTSGGFAFTEEDVAEGSHVLVLTINSQDMVISGFAMQPSPLFQILPLEVQQQLVFDIPEYEDNDPFGVPLDVRQKIVAEFTRVYKKAQEMFNG